MKKLIVISILILFCAANVEAEGAITNCWHPPCETCETCETCEDTITVIEVPGNCADGGCCTVKLTFKAEGEPSFRVQWREVPTLDDKLIFPSGGECIVDRVLWRDRSKAQATIYCTDGTVVEAKTVDADQAETAAVNPCDVGIDFYFNGLFYKAVRWCEVPKQGEEIQTRQGLCTVEEVAWEVGDNANAIVYCSDTVEAVSLSDMFKDEKSTASGCPIATLMGE